MLSEVFIRFNKDMKMEDVEKLIKESIKVYPVRYEAKDWLSGRMEPVLGLLIIHKCGLIKCDCFDSNGEQKCVCGFAIIADLFNQECLDRFEPYITCLIEDVRIEDRIRPM